jgi:hypothetical protein
MFGLFGFENQIIGAFFFDFLHEIALKTSKFSPPAGSKISFQQLFSHGFSLIPLNAKKNKNFEFVKNKAHSCVRIGEKI